MHKIVLIGIVGLLIGWFGRSLYPSAETGQEHGLPSSALLDDRETEKPVLPTKIENPNGQGSGAPAPPEGNQKNDLADPNVHGERIVPAQMFSPVLLQYFAREYKKRWLETRADAPGANDFNAGEMEFRKEVLMLPRMLAHQHAQAVSLGEEFVEGLKNGDPLALVAGLESGMWTPNAEEVSPELMDKVFAARSNAGARDGTEFSKDKTQYLTPGTVLRFGAGVHVLSQGRLRIEGTGEFPADITIVGAGMDATLLRIGDIMARTNALRLRFIDLTLDCDNDGLFDMRGGSLVCEMQNVRVVRFDAGHGGCSVFSARGGLVARAINCRFEGGYGKSPGNRGAFLLRSPFVVARFENCTFEGIQTKPRDEKGRIVYTGCRFEGYGRRMTLASNEFETYNSCVVTDSDEGRPVRKSLNDLFWNGLKD